MLTSAIVPNLTPIPLERSSSIEAMGYDAEVLFVLFRSTHSLYAYDQVTPEEYKALAASQELGKIFGATIKGVKPYKALGKWKEETSTNLLVMPPEAPEGQQSALQAKAREWSERAMGLKVEDTASHQMAQEVILHMASVRKEIEDFMKPMKAQAHKAWRTVCDQENSLLKPLEAADKMLRLRVGDYTYLQVTRAQEEDERLRHEAEEKALAEASQKALDASLRAALELEGLGDHEGAEAVLEHPMPPERVFPVLPPPIQPQVAQVEGMSQQLVFEVTIHDISQVPREFLVIDLEKTRVEIARRARQVQGRLQVSGATIRQTYTARRVGRR